MKQVTVRAAWAAVIAAAVSVVACDSPGQPAVQAPARTPPPKTSSSPLPIVTPSPSPPVVREAVTKPGGPAAATELRAEAECGLGDEPVVHLSWVPAQDAGKVQRIAVTAFSNGFETGNYKTSPRLAVDISSYEWQRTDASVAYRWRVLTLHADVWRPSRIHGFIGPSCGVADRG